MEQSLEAIYQQGHKTFSLISNDSSSYFSAENIIITLEREDINPHLACNKGVGWESVTNSSETGICPLLGNIKS